MAKYCEEEEIGVYGVNAEAIEGLGLADRITPAIEAASDEMDSYLRSQYTLPLISWGSDLRACAAVIAAWNIVRVRGFRPGDNPEDSALYLEYKAKIRWLEQIAADTVHPEVTDSSSGAQVGVSTVSLPIISSNVQRGYFNDDPGSALPFQGRRQS
jgi:phage gp36-like protein